MPARQLRLFDPPKPLLDRLGKAFFRELPRGPGVYTMRDSEGRILYIGQSGNLRARVSSYRHVHPDRTSRKLVRLVHSVASISWETCDSVAEARLRETHLLRLHRPRFNTANTYPAGYLFIGLRRSSSELELSIGSKLQTDFQKFGAFKPRSRAAFDALIRCIWAVLHQPESLDEFPLGLLSARPHPARQFELAQRHARVPVHDSLPEAVADYLGGLSPAIIALLESALPPLSGLCAAQQNLHAQDLLILEEFFVYGPKRNLDLALQFGLSGPLIEQDQLDDFLIRAPDGIR